MSELAAKMKTSKRMKLKARAAHSKALQKDAEAQACGAALETAEKAEDAAVVLQARGVDVQSLQTLAAIANQPDAVYKDFEAATAAVEVLEADLLAKSELKHLKKVKKVSAMARTAMVNCCNAQEAALACEASLDIAADTCHTIHDTLQDSGDSELAGAVGALAMTLEAEVLSFEDLDSATTDAIKVTSQLLALPGRAASWAAMEEVVAKMGNAKKIELQAKAAHNKAVLSEAEMQAEEANMEAVDGAERTSLEMGHLSSEQMQAVQGDATSHCLHLFTRCYLIPCVDLPSL